MGDDGPVRSHPPPVDPLIATRSTADHDTSRDRDDRGIPPGTADATDGFGLFAAPPEPVAAWHRAPSPHPRARPGLLVPAAVLATVAAIWAIAELRPAPTDPTATATADDAPPVSAETVGVAVVRLEHRDGATVVELSLTNTGTAAEVLSNHVWVVREGLAFPEATAAVACLATDDRPDKPLPAVSQVTAEAPADAGAARACGVGGFVSAPGAPARIALTITGLEPGDHRVIVAAGSSPVFTVP